MSGGVDSSVAAYLLLQQGFDVTGVFMKNWSDPLADKCPWEDDLKDFISVCHKLKIKSKIEIFEEQYRKKIVKYLIDGYKKGLTPNPDMLCNKEIKFKLFLDKARKLGADYIATGHYVISKSEKVKDKTIYYLFMAKDSNKDQSYFLSLLNQSQLKYSLFPIGNLLKPDVRIIAKKAGIPVYNKKDSQGICFIGKVKFSDFIRTFIPSKYGNIVTTSGEIIGRHDGLPFYTIGQRHGLKVGGGTPYYVVKKQKKENNLVVSKGAKDKSLYSLSANISNFSWISGVPPSFPINCFAKIRYRQKSQKCVVVKKGDRLLIKFNKMQRAITPGQFAVLYDKKMLLGGGVIMAE